MRKRLIIKYFIIIICSITTLFLMGYHYGTFDQASHIPFLKKISNPSLYPNDPFFSLIKTHPSFFWFLFIPFLRAEMLEIALFVVYVICLFSTYLSIWILADTLFNSFEISALSTIVWIFPHLGFAGFPLFEFSLVNRTFLLPFVLLSLTFYLKKKYITSFSLAGILFNFHALSVFYLLIVYGCDIFFSRLYRNKSIIFGIIIFFVLASPILYWSFLTQTILSFASIHEWFILISKSMMSNIFYPLHINPPYILLTIGGFFSIMLFYVSKKHLPSKQSHNVISHFMTGVLLTVILFGFSSYIFPIEFVIKTQAIRIGIFSIIFGYLFSCAYIWNKYKNHKDKKEFIFSFGVLLFSIIPFFPFLYFLIKKNPLLKALVVIFIFLSVIFCTLFSYQNNIWKPAIKIYPHKSDYYQAQIWAKKNTPINSLFITPPYMWAIYEPEWRVFSERSTVVVLSDTLEMAFSPSYTSIWKNRFNDVVPNTVEKFNYNYFENNKKVRETYLSLSDEYISNLGKKYKANYFITENVKKYPFPLMYKNSTYSIYLLSK